MCAPIFVILHLMLTLRKLNSATKIFQCSVFIGEKPLSGKIDQLQTLCGGFCRMGGSENPYLMREEKKQKAMPTKNGQKAHSVKTVHCHLSKK